MARLPFHAASTGAVAHAVAHAVAILVAAVAAIGDDSARLVSQQQLTRRAARACARPHHLRIAAAATTARKRAPFALVFFPRRAACAHERLRARVYMRRVSCFLASIVEGARAHDRAATSRHRRLTDLIALLSRATDHCALLRKRRVMRASKRHASARRVANLSERAADICERRPPSAAAAAAERASAF